MKPLKGFDGCVVDAGVVRTVLAKGFDVAAGFAPNAEANGFGTAPELALELESLFLNHNGGKVFEGEHKVVGLNILQCQSFSARQFLLICASEMPRIIVIIATIISSFELFLFLRKVLVSFVSTLGIVALGRTLDIWSPSIARFFISHLLSD